MHIQHFITVNAAVLIVLFAVSCSKSSSEPTVQKTKMRQASSLPANMPKKDLGEIELSAHTLKRVALSADKECVISPILLANGNLQMDLAVETKTSDGKIQRLDQVRLTTRPGQQCTISVGGMMVGLTPKLKAQ